MTESDSLTITEELPREHVAAVIRHGVMTLGLIAIIVLGFNLPGTTQEIGSTGITVGEVVLAIGTLGMVAIVLSASWKVRDLVAASLEGPSRIVSETAAITQHILVFVAVLIAYRGFAPISYPYSTEWPYNLAFLLLALAPLGLIVYEFSRAVGPITDLLTDRLMAREDQPSAVHPGENPR